MSILTSGLPTHDRLGNPVFYDFRNMMMVDSLFSKTDKDNLMIWEQALQWLYGQESIEYGEPNDWLKELVWFYSGGQETGKKDKKEVELLSFERDAEFIHADFLTSYGIDLSEVDLHWWKFLSLMKALPENTTMSRRMYYRGVPLSEFKGEERKRIAKIKKEIAINKTCPVAYKTAEEKAQAYKERLQRLAKRALQGTK